MDPNFNQLNNDYRPDMQEMRNLYQNNNNPYNNDLEEPVTLGEWILTMIVLAIPCVGIIMTFVWAFGGQAKRSKQNFCKATLIFMAISIVFTVFLSLVFGASFFT